MGRHQATMLETKLSDEEQGLTADDVHFSNVEPRGHHRFAAGRCLPMPYIAALYTQAYYTPGVLEMLEALVNPGKTKQVAVVWAMEIPKHYINKEYTKLAMKVIRDGGVPLGLLRSPDAGDTKAPLPCDHLHALPLGVQDLQARPPWQLPTTLQILRLGGSVQLDG